MLVGSSTSKKRSFSDEDYQVSRMCKTMVNVKLNQKPKGNLHPSSKFTLTNNIL
jgi:hypothetical protein